jgi:hypothetical protein
MNILYIQISSIITNIVSMKKGEPGPMGYQGDQVIYLKYLKHTIRDFFYFS